MFVSNRLQTSAQVLISRIYKGTRPNQNTEKAANPAVKVDRRPQLTLHECPACTTNI